MLTYLTFTFTSTFHPARFQGPSVGISSSSSSSDSSLQSPFVHYLLERLRSPEERRSPEWVEEVCGVLSVIPCGSADHHHQQHQQQGARRGQHHLQALCEELWALRGTALTEERVLGSLLRPRADDTTLVGLYCGTALRLQRDHLLRNTPGVPGW